MAGGTILHVATSGLGDSRGWTSPYPGDAWLFRSADPLEAAIQEAGESEVDALVVVASTVTGVLESVRKVARQKTAVVILAHAPTMAERELCSASGIGVVNTNQPEPGQIQDLANALERARIDQQIYKLHDLGGNEFLTDMIELFAGQTAQQISDIRKAFAGGDFETLQRTAHSMKSSAGNFGARALQSLAYQTEQAGAARQSQGTGQLIDDLDAAFQRAAGIVKSMSPA